MEEEGIVAVGREDDEDERSVGEVYVERERAAMARTGYWEKSSWTCFGRLG